MRNKKGSNRRKRISKVDYIKAAFMILFVLTLSVGNAQSVGRSEEGFHLISQRGEKLTEAYDFIQLQEFGLHLASLNGKFGYLDGGGKIAIPLKYDVAYPFNGSFALVGNAGKYYHINKTNQVLDSMDWPKAPLVYNQLFLVLNEAENKVIYEDGSELLSSDHQLILAKMGGIIEWNEQNDSVFQYASVAGRKELKLINSFSVIDEPVLTNQGYLCIPQLNEGENIYSVYDDNGKQLVKCAMDGVDPNLIHVVWNNYVYVPREENSIQEYYQFGRETHFQMNELWKRGQNYLGHHNFQLSNKYAKDKMILLKNTYKWLRFDGNHVQGSHLFDEVIPGDEYLTPVKMGEKWYLLDYRLDSLILLPYAQIHPIGMNRGRFFASSEESGNIIEKKWALVNLKTKTVTEEIYQVPILPEAFLVYDQESRYNWNVQTNEVIKDGKRILLDYYGNEVWIDPPNSPLTIDDFFTLNFAFEFDNFKDLAKKNSYKKNQISLVIQPISSGVLIQLINTKKTGESVPIQDGHIEAIIEMKSSDDTWVKVGYLPPSTCGNSYYSDYFPPNKMASTTVNFPKGEQLIKIRVVLDEYSENKIISNEIQIKTNGARMWVNKYCGGFGCVTRK